jgi:WhiB family redox-sensing transcriptional regulator
MTHTAAVPWANTPRPRTSPPSSVTRAKFTDTEPAGENWRHRAECVNEDPELFFPIGNTGPALLQIEDAKAVCRRCDVIDRCLTWALESGQDHGVAGGASEDERRTMKRRESRRRQQDARRDAA